MTIKPKKAEKAKEQGAEPEQDPQQKSYLMYFGFDSHRLTPASEPDVTEQSRATAGTNEIKGDASGGVSALKVPPGTPKR